MLRAFRWALLWALLILVLCLMPGTALPMWHWADLFSVDKLVHAFLFAVLTLLCLRAFEAPGPKTVLAAVLACAAYGGGLELMQMLPGLGRRGDWNDFTANTVGVALGWAGQRWWRSRRRRARLGADA